MVNDDVVNLVVVVIVALAVVNSTPHRAFLSRATHAIFVVCTWLKGQAAQVV